VACVLDELPRAGRVAVLRLRSLGDCVLTTPALEILKRHRPDLRVAVAVEDRFRAVFEDNPDVDEILAPALRAVRQFRPQLCLNLHGGTRSAWLTAASGARWRAGFGHFRNAWAYNVRIPRAQEILGVERTVHTAEHLASTMFWLGAPMGEVPRAKMLAGGQGRGAGRSLTVAAPSRVYAVIHATAAAALKTWRSNGFVAVAEHLRCSGIEPVFIGAASDDLSAFERFRVVQGAPLGEVKRLLASASLFVGNDSGPAHMAAAFGLPVVVIFGNSNPAIWGPWRTAAEVVTAPGGIAQVSVEQVMDALARLRVDA
jgi:ADP-heptose:LPS heptosyltransferase